MPTVLLTGATAGLGRYLATRLHALGWTVVLHGRDQRKLEAVRSHLSGQGTPIRLCRADLASLSEVRSLAQRVLDEVPELDVLVNNAAVGYGPPDEPRQVSQDGHELRFAVNYLAPMLLSALLAPKLAERGHARIVNVGSTNQGPFDTRDLPLRNGYSGAVAYRRSKLALTAGTFDMAATTRATGVDVNCVHPASRMDTAMVRQSGTAAESTVQEGAEPVLRLITDPAMAGTTGLFFDGFTTARAHQGAYDDRFRAWLRVVTARLLAP
ncbi:hypothetical protein ALI22I_00475 [Saccharothrix sp. ALI-22-I]|uniref:SDR family NAD(P)-dependent oxidoreductase n=1 Tax=Saccharothrix sp. ALI-22-I TaxID=1933778 RepID=UPI00097C22F3|nr:SDR family NAD(P)-dependent oxidoreductase [Saccharothrix sp. ALI-22-I]ONI93031.1 hypothetical protein ALI22I_00475 [Saccharothrix sp. ALI-22-I]